MEAVGHRRFAAILGADAVLVPVPGCDPSRQGPWVGERLAWCLKEMGLAAAVRPMLRRRHAVRKSASAPTGERPTVPEHYRSFAIEQPADIFPRSSRMHPPPHLVLVDDVITRGRTLLAAAIRLREAFPAAQIRAFALLRTLEREEILRRVLDPCEGEVRWIRGDARRAP